MIHVLVNTVNFVTESGMGFTAGGNEVSQLLMCQWGCNNFITFPHQEVNEEHCLDVWWEKPPSVFGVGFEACCSHSILL